MKSETVNKYITATTTTTIVFHDLCFFSHDATLMAVKVSLNDMCCITTRVTYLLTCCERVVVEARRFTPEPKLTLPRRITPWVWPVCSTELQRIWCMLRVGIVGRGGGWTPNSCLQTLIFEWKAAL